MGKVSWHWQQTGADVVFGDEQANWAKHIVLLVTFIDVAHRAIIAKRIDLDI